VKAVVLDGYTLNPGDLNWNGLSELCELTVYDRTAYDVAGLQQIVERVGEAEVVFSNKTPLPTKAFQYMPNVKYIGVFATGYNIVDVEAAKKRGITVTNVPTYGTGTVAQMAIALLLELCHHIGAHSDAVSRGEWSNNADWCFWRYPIVELDGKTIGIIGFGKIGQAVGKIAQALGMDVLVFDRYPRKELENDTLHYVKLDELLKNSDMISLHCPLFKDTEGIIGRNNIAKMKDGVMIINNSRGALIVEEDLAEALNSGKVAGAALDVVSSEPIHADNPLLQAKNCIITPHISWASKEARQRLLDIGTDNFRKFIKGTPVNVVNK
jgi:Lactate dehydrogenase and related dehydrogenases